MPVSIDSLPAYKHDPRPLNQSHISYATITFVRVLMATQGRESIAPPGLNSGRPSPNMRTTWLGSLVLSTLLGCVQVLGISQRDAGLHDWHLELVGMPALETGTSPRFHYPAGPTNTASSSLVYTATQKNVLAALDPKTGVIAWRHVFPDSQPILRYELHGDSILAITGPGGAQAHLFSATSGHSKWSIDLHSPTEGLLPEPASIATDAVFYQVSDDPAAGIDILCLSNGHELRRINGMNGQTAWSWKLNSATEPTLQLHAILPPATNADSIQVVLIKRVTGSYILLTSTISRVGAVSREPTVITNTAFESLENLLLFKPMSGTVEARAVYLDMKGDIKSIFFFRDGSQDPIQTAFKSQGKYVSLTQIGLEEKGIFVGKRADGTSSILQVGSDGQVKALHEYRDAVEDGLYSGFVDREGVTHVSRYSISAVLGLARMATFTLEATEHNDAGIVFDTTFPYPPKKNGQILHVAAEIAPRKSSNLMFRLCITSASGSFQGWLGGGIQWSREEGLAHLSYNNGEPSIAFLVVPSSSHAAAASIVAPAIGSIKSIFTKPLELVGLLSAGQDVSTYVGRDWLGDAFGYRKLVIIGTEFGKLLALDLGNGGKVVWESYAVPLHLVNSDNQVSWKSIAVFDKRADGRVLVAAIAETMNAENQARVRAFYVDGLTGKPFVRSGSDPILSEHPVGNVLVNQGSFDPAFLLISKDSKSILEESPSTIIAPATSGHSSPPHLSYVDMARSDHLQGWHALISSGSNPIQTDPSWKYTLPEGSRIAAHAHQTNGKVASIGRVLGDRSTLYKYINPHLLAIATLEDNSATLEVHLIDMITGGVVWEGRHSGDVEISAPVAVSLTENWLTYSYSEKDLEGKQTKVVSVELFENATQEVKASSTFSSYEKHQPYALSKAYIFPGRITSMSTSQTKHGVTSKALLVTTSTDQIVAIPRRFLDPRRPMQKPTKAEMEEYLVPYEPVIPVDPKWVISHRYRIAGMRGVLTSSTILESTSQILAYGMDLFGSSVSPSGRFDVLSRDFNKAQLIGTTLGLMGAIAVLRPIVNRKKLTERWYPA